MTELSEDVVGFLSHGTRTGMLGFVASDGRPLVAPVWFIVEHGELVFNTGAKTAKGRALQRDSRVVLCVDDPHPPFSFVQVQGEATAIADADDLQDIATRIAARYVGAESAEAFGRRNAAPGELVVRVRPTKVNAAFGIAD